MGLMHILSIFRLQQCEEDKLTKDSQIRSLKEELASQEELGMVSNKLLFFLIVIKISKQQSILYI